VARQSLSRHQFARTRLSLQAPPHQAQVCLELSDHSVARYSAVDFFHTRVARDPAAQAARIAEQFIALNRALMLRLDARMERDYDGRDLWLVVSSASCVGAVPLFSSTTARLDFGLVIQPRFPWLGIGPMLAAMGWRVAPTPLRLPLLRRSERRVPVWVLSFMIVTRLKVLLDSLDRRFEMIHESRQAPRGTVNWNGYATKSLPSANLLSVPCTFPDLRDDRLLKGAIRTAIEKQIRALETQKDHGAFVHRLIEFAETLLRRVHSVAPYLPSTSTLTTWLHRPMRSEQFADGLQAIEWTVEERGLAGLSDLEGIPWTMRMDQFFESWIETVFALVARRTGGQMRVGRKRETVHALNWEPPYLGSQKALIPDLWLEWQDTTLIVDAKYKRHWEEIQEKLWGNVEQLLREEHRADLLQALAYAALGQTRNVIACLIYPCTPERWLSLASRGRLFHRASVSVGSRSLKLWLTAVPMDAAVERVANPITEQIRAALGRA
jgi:McrBC 5-methylcytosine restriction system component